MIGRRAREQLLELTVRFVTEAYWQIRAQISTGSEKVVKRADPPPQLFEFKSSVDAPAEAEAA